MPMYRREQRGLLTVILLAALATAILWIADRQTAEHDTDDIAAVISRRQAEADSAAARREDERLRIQQQRKATRQTAHRRSTRRSQPQPVTEPRRPLDDVVPVPAENQD